MWAETPIRESFFLGAAFFRAAQLSLDLPGKNCYDTVKIKLAPKELERALIKNELTSRNKQAMEMRSRIQAVALELFDKEGFENVSVEQIAQAAGCSVGNIYHYFKSKDELVIQVTSSVDATSSMATDLIKGKTIDEALKLTNKAVVEALEGLPPIKVHCSVLAEQAVKAALSDYYRRQGIDPEPIVGKLEEDCDHCESCGH